jgi:hypothetical protein
VATRHRHAPQLRRHETNDSHPMTAQPTVFACARRCLLTLKMTPSFIRAHGTGLRARAGQLPLPLAQCPMAEQSFRHRYGPQLRRHETSDPHPMTAQPTVFVLQCEDCGRLRSTMRASTCPWLRKQYQRYISCQRP